VKTTSAPMPLAEKPLSAPARLGLAAMLALLNLLLYLFCLLMLLAVGALIVLDIAVLIALLRVGMSRLMIQPLERLFRLARVTLSSLRLEQGTRFHLSLTEADAPRLFALVRDCARRVGCPEPTALVMEMAQSAWIQIEGYRQGRGKSTLCLGFDLLATFSESELEAIVLHEMAHAKLVQRGLKNWTVRGMLRAHRLTQALQALEREERARRERPQNKRAGQLWSQFYTAQILAFLSGTIARAETRLFAAYSRQDEFLADRLSAEQCGAQTFGNALLKTVVISLKARELPWGDRIVQSQREESYTQWLRQKLLPADAAETARLIQEALATDRRSPFDTHPTLEDRFASVGARLPVPGELPSPPTQDAPSDASTRMLIPLQTAPVAWLRDSDALADRLFDQIERVQAEEERKESEALSRWERKSRRQFRRSMTALEWLGVFFILCGIVGLLGAMASLGADMAPLPWLLSSLLLILGGIVVARRGAPSGPRTLPIPEYTQWEDSFKAARNAAHKHALTSLNCLPRAPGPPTSARKPEKLRYWSEQGYAALTACDYKEALACGLRCLDIHKNCAEGLLLAGVASQCLGAERAGSAHLAQAVCVFSGNPWVNWAVAWGCLAAGNYVAAEAHLLGLIERVPLHPTLLGALGMIQLQRGKTRAAIANLRRAVTLTPETARLRLRLAQALLSAGKAREASAELAYLERLPGGLQDRDALLASVRAHLMRDHREPADAQARLLEAQHACPETFFLLGMAYARVKLWEEAAAYFHRATADALYPAAWVGLGRYYAQKQQTAEARACYLGALNLLHPLAPEAEGPLELLSAALEGLRDLREPTEPLKTWEMRLRVRALPPFQMDQFHLLLLAQDRNEALAYADELLQAMHPGAPPARSLLFHLELAALEPPDRPTQPGIIDWRGMAAAD